MGEELDEDQLFEFCQRLNLAKNGYLDENELSTACKFIGLNVPDEMMKELFESLDEDKDGKVELSELSQMFRGMNKKPSSPPKKKMDSPSSSSMILSTVELNSTGNYCTVPLICSLTIFDPENTGYSTLANILDIWSQLGISQEFGLGIIKDLGFTTNSKSIAINLLDLSKSIEDFVEESAKEMKISPILHAALLTYRTELSYLKTFCDSVECERDKLKSDILDAHQRSSMMAQEVDEQNAKLERNSQILIKQLDTKYNEQIQDVQKRLTGEKENLNQALIHAEAELCLMKEEDGRLKNQISKLKSENVNLEKEVQNLNFEVKNITRFKDQLEREISRYLDIENRLQEVEKRNSENVSSYEDKIKKSHNDIQNLRDQNDELNAQLEGMRETLRIVKASEEKRSYYKRRKGSVPLTSSLALTLFNGVEETIEEKSELPMEKIGKFNPQLELEMFQQNEEPEEFCDPVLSSSCSSQPDSGNFPSTNTMSLAACMGEKYSEQINYVPPPPPPLEEDRETYSDMNQDQTNFLLFNIPSINNNNNNNVEKLEKQYKTLESEMDSVKEKIVKIISEKELVLKENEHLKKQLGYQDNNSSSVNGRNSRSNIFSIPRRLSLPSAQLKSDISTQTNIIEITTQNEDKIFDKIEESEISLNSNLKSRIINLEEENVKSLTEKEQIQEQCNELECSLELLREEYDKCEDYWHMKLKEERENYEEEKKFNDEKINELIYKIKEYEELYMNNSEKLSPIVEQASLERQVEDLEDECEHLKNELVYKKVEQESIISVCHKNWETKYLEDTNRLEGQVSALSSKCGEYEKRLNALAEEEKIMLEENEKRIVNGLKGRIQQLEYELNAQEKNYRIQIANLEKCLRERDEKLSKNHELVKVKTNRQNHSQAQAEMQFQQGNSKKDDLQISKHQLQSAFDKYAISNGMKHEPFWQAKRIMGPFNQKTTSLPFIPYMDNTYPENYSNSFGSWTMTSSPPLPSAFQQDIWPSFPTSGVNKKGWCNVEYKSLQNIRIKLKQRDEQCYVLQKCLKEREMQTEKCLAEMKYQHEAVRQSENSNWESLMLASQELVRQQALKHKEQAEKLAQADLLIKDLWIENAKLMAALNSTEQKVSHLENLLRYQMQVNSQRSNTPFSNNNNNNGNGGGNSSPFLSSNTYHNF